MDAGLIFRPYTELDIPFIRSSWANSYYKGCDDHKLIPHEEFHTYHRKLIDRFFERTTSAVIIVHFEEEPEVIMGWIAVELLTNCLAIHYIYIKSTFKKEGIMAAMIDKVNGKKANIIVTHLTDKAKRILNNHPKYRDFKFIPHLV